MHIHIERHYAESSEALLPRVSGFLKANRKRYFLMKFHSRFVGVLNRRVCSKVVISCFFYTDCRLSQGEDVAYYNH